MGFGVGGWGVVGFSLRGLSVVCHFGLDGLGSVGRSKLHAILDLE